jgi:hypothetical protein
MIGVAADIYAGRWDGMRYLPDKETGTISTDQEIEISDLVKETDTDLDKFLKWAGVDSINQILRSNYDATIGLLNSKKNRQREPGMEG